MKSPMPAVLRLKFKQLSWIKFVPHVLVILGLVSPPAWAQQPTTAVGQAVQNFAAPLASGIAGGMGGGGDPFTGEMTACSLARASAIAALDKNPKKNSSPTVACPSPFKVPAKPACGAFFESDGTTVSFKKYKEYEEKKRKGVGQYKTIDDYTKYLEKLKSDCLGSDEKTERDLKVAAAYQTELACQKGVIDKALNAYSKAIQDSVQGENQSIGAINTDESAINGQVQQLNEWLSPDGLTKGSLSVGLIAAEKQVTDALMSADTSIAKFKNDEQKIKENSRNIKRELDQKRADFISSCLKEDKNFVGMGGKGTTSYKCLRPVQVGKDPQGNPIYGTKRVHAVCSPFEYIKNQLEFGAAARVNTQRNRDRGSNDAADFEAIVNEAQRMVKDENTKGLEGESYVPSQINNADIKNRLAQRMSDLSTRSKVNIGPMLNRVLDGCFQQGNRRVSFLLTKDPEISSKVVQMQGDQENLNSELRKNINALSGVFEKNIVALGLTTRTIKTGACTQNNSTLMRACVTQLRDKLEDLLNDDGAFTVTRNFSGGGRVPPSAIQCRGIKQCVQVAKLKVDQATQAQNQLSQQRAQIQQQGFRKAQAVLAQKGTSLATLQSTLRRSFGDYKKHLVALGIHDVKDLKLSKEGADLELDPGDKGPPPRGPAGVFKSPEDWSKVIGKAAGGMIDPESLSFDDIGTKLADARKDKKSEQDRLREDLDKLIGDMNVEGLCGSNSCLGSQCNSVGNSNGQECEQCTEAGLAACLRTATDANSVKKSELENKSIEEMKSLLSNLRKLVSGNLSKTECENLAKACATSCYSADKRWGGNKTSQEAAAGAVK